MTKYKIPLILAITFTSILFLSIVTLSVLRTNTKPNLPAPDEIKIYKQSTSVSATYKSGTDDYEEIMKLYNVMFEKTYLSQLSDNAILPENLSEDTYAPLWSDVNKETGLYVEFIYSTPKKFIVNRDNNTRRVDVSSIIFELSKVDSCEDIYIYYTIKTDSSSSSSSSENEDASTEPNYPIVAKANTHDLYKHIISKDNEE